MYGRRPKIQIHVITKKRVKDVEKHDNQTNTLHYQIHETFKHNGTY